MEVTGVEDQTAPGQMPLMMELAGETFGDDPVIMTHDERSVC